MSIAKKPAPTEGTAAAEHNVAKSWGFIWLWRALSVTVFYLVLLTCIALGFVFLSESAPRWLWQQAKSSLPELHINGLSGTLATGLAVKQLSWKNEATALQIDELALSLSYPRLLTGRLVLANVQAKSVSVQALKASEPEVFVPPTIHLPLRWGLPHVRIQQLQWRAFDAQALTIKALALSAQGAGNNITLDELALAYSDWQVKAQVDLSLREQWPVRATITLASQYLAGQRISIDGDLSALRARLRGPKQYPVALDATVNTLLPTLPFNGRVSWPQWLLPGQTDWRLEPGAMTFAGSTEQGELDLNLRASLLKTSALEWPKNAPRTAYLAGLLRWQSPEGKHRASVDWQGKLGNAPWVVHAHYDQSKPAQTLLNMRLADALVSAKGWPDSGLIASVHIPQLQRFQTQFAGALTTDVQWRGAWPDGQGDVSLLLKQLAQRHPKAASTPLLNHAKIRLAGRIEKHQLTLEAEADQGAVSLQAAGGLALKTQVWSGRLNQATLMPKQTRWQLKQAFNLSLSIKESHIDQACWQQTDAAFSPWLVCLQADLDPKQWLAKLAVKAPQGGDIAANFRRDPTAKNPPLDADIRWQDINLAELPMALPEGLAFSGRSDGDIRAAGTLEKPLLTGQWSVGASLSWPRYGIKWPELSVDGRLTGQRASWQAQLKDSSNGQLTIAGEAGWQPNITLSSRITGDKLAFAYAPWVQQGRVSPTVDVTWLNDQLTVSGEVLVNRADITLKSLAAGAPKPSADVVIVRNREGRVLALNDAPSSLPLFLRLRILLGDDISLSGYGLNAGLYGQLLLTQNPHTALAANGEIGLKADAQFAAYGQRLTIEQGRLLFVGPLSKPDIRLSASRQIDGVKVGVNVAGLAPSPAVTLTSDSPMSQDEILSYLVLGRSLGNGQENSAADKQALALSAALNLTGKTGAIGLLGERLGISDFAIGTQGNSDSTELAVSGRLSEKVWLSIGRGVFQPSQSVTVRYQINRRLSLEALSALESAITLFYSWRF